MAVCVGVCGLGSCFWVAVPGGWGVNRCLGGVVDIKRDSTGNGALAERANVCTNVKCPFPPCGRRAGDLRKACEFP